GPAPTGSVTFWDGATLLATMPLDVTGGASYTAPALTAGHHFITATYNGDGQYGPGSMELVQPVLQTATVTVVSSATPAGSSQSVSFTATVAAGRSTVNVPEGTVNFRDGSTVLGTVALNPLGLVSTGQVSFTPSA